MFYVFVQNFKFEGNVSDGAVQIKFQNAKFNDYDNSANQGTHANFGDYKEGIKDNDTEKSRVLILRNICNGVQIFFNLRNFMELMHARSLGQAPYGADVDDEGVV